MVIKYKVSEDRPFFNGEFWPKGVPKQLDYDYTLNLRDLLENAAQKWPDWKAMNFIKKSITYAEFKDMVDRFATSLTNFGVKKGDVVAVHLPNCIQYVVAYYAITSLGAIVTGVNPTYKPLEILHQFKTTKTTYLVVLDALFKRDYGPIKDKYELKKVIHTNVGDLISGIIRFLAKKIKKVEAMQDFPVDHPNAISFKECLDVTPNVPKVKIDTEKDPATLIMTGGTTGVPKAAVLTHQNVVANAIQCKEILLNQRAEGSSMELGPKTCMMGVLPLYHSFAMTTVMNTTIAVGGWMMLYPKPPETEELLKDLSKLPNENGFIYCAAEILFQRIAELPDDVLAKYDIGGRLKLCISGAGPLHDYVREPFERKTGAKITEGYGLTEASPVVSCNNFYGKRESGYIGVPAPGTDWDIFDAEDFSKGPKQGFGEENTGEICVWGPQVMKGYWKMPDRTEANIKEYDGRRWLLTGDIGFMDEHGRIAIRDRKKQLIKMSGHSVFPAEVESLIGSHPKVLEAAVAGIPDKKLGEYVKAWVALRPEAVGTITSEELLSWAMDNMTKWKCPKEIEIIDEIPKSNVGKIMRRTLQESDPNFIEVHGKPKGI